MKYHKYLDIDNLEIIQKKTLEYIVQNKFDCVSGFRHMDWDRYVIECPEILSAFNRYNTFPVNGFLCVSSKLTDFNIHIDYISDEYHLCRINIPILNCRGTLTVFYTGGEYDIYVQRNNLAAFAIKPNDNSTVKVDEVEIIKPTIIRVQEPHRIITDITNIPRISMTLVMNKDPVSLLEDDNVYG